MDIWKKKSTSQILVDIVVHFTYGIKNSVLQKEGECQQPEKYKSII